MLELSMLAERFAAVHGGRDQVKVGSLRGVVVAGELALELVGHRAQVGLRAGLARRSPSTRVG